MRRAPAIAVALLALAAAARGSQDAGTVLAPGGAGEWKPLLDTLAARATVVAPFTEHRYFPFRREPLVLHGVLRISRERGMSLEYTDPEPSIVIADPAGLLLRDKNGRVRALAAGSRESGSLASLLPIMRFDLAPLYPRFTITARRDGQAWTLAFAPREPALAASIGEILVQGSGPEVRHLEFRRSASQRVEIEVGEARTGAAFSPEDLRRFFR
jgi:hypothetical protein